jgi:DNA-binding transcriptional MerR regulator/predicted transcriptional regulator YdeE
MMLGGMERDQRLVPISRYARFVGLTVKALRHYDAIGLLEPAEVDAWTGYRLYLMDQVPRGRLIRRLRDLGLTLAEVRLALEDGSRIQGLLREALARLEAEEQSLSKRRSQLSLILDEGAPLMPIASDLDVTLVDVPERHVLKVNTTARLEEFPRIIPENIMRIFRVAPREAGPPYFICFEEPTDAVPVEIGVIVPAPVTEAPDGITPGTLPAVRAARAIHRGPFEQIMDAYSAVWNWIDQQGLRVAGPARELYLSDPAKVPNPADYETELLWPVSGG